MAKLTLTDISSGYLSTSTFNANNTLIETALENTLSRDGTSPNTMGANLDMNSNRVVNLTDGVGNQDAVTVAQLNSAVLGGATSISAIDDVTITSIASGELLKWDGAGWINNTLAEAGISAVGHTHVIADITDFTDNSTNWNTAYGWGDHSGLYASTSHTHEGTTIDATAVTDGYVLTADGAGNAAWEVLPASGVSAAANEDITGAWDFQNVFRISNTAAPVTDYVDFTHDGTDFKVAPAATTEFLIDGTDLIRFTVDNADVWIKSGQYLYLEGPTATYNYNVRTTSGALQHSYTNITSVLHTDSTGSGAIHDWKDGAILRIYDNADSKNGYFNHDGTNFNIYVSSGALKVTAGSLMVNEGASAPADIAAFGQYWVKNDVPNTPWFTDDAGNDYPLGTAAYRMYANQTDTVDGLYVNGTWYSDNATAYTLTLEASSSTAFPVGAQFTIWNEGSGTLTINEGTGDTLYLLDGSSVTDTAGGCTMAQGGYATVIRKSAAVWLIMGAGITA